MKMKKIISTILSSALVLQMGAAVPVYADDTSSSNLTYATGVTEEMCSADYWAEQSVLGADTILADSDAVSAYNTSAYESSGTNIYGIEKMAETFTVKDPVTNQALPTKSLYIDGTLIDKETYFANIKTQFASTSMTVGETADTRFGICVQRADLKSWPTTDVIGYSASDPDDELESSALVVNEPFVIRQECTIDDVQYYWGYTDNCTGWVRADCIGVCDSKDTWLEQWNFGLEDDDFLVVMQDQITLEASYLQSETSKVRLDIGCALQLVPEDEWSDAISDLAERGTWNNYVVYLPIRLEDGSYDKVCALISQHYDVHIGYADLTEQAVLDLAFSCLGNRYGWGGMLEAFDCSMYVRNIYRCFGYTVPRNTSWQRLVDGYVTAFSTTTSDETTEWSDEEKAEYIASLPIGSVLFFSSGHEMIYVGTVDGVNYVISATGSLSDATEETSVQSMYSVILTPLTVKRKNGTTWLNNLTHAVTYTSLRHEAHVETVTKQAVAPTCTTTGVTEEISCALCGEVLQEQTEIAMTSHNWNEGKVLIKPTKETDGVMCYTCSTCGKQRTQTYASDITYVTKLKIKGASHRVAEGKKLKLTAYVMPKNATTTKVVWKSSNKKVASVSQDGVVKVKKDTAGRAADITATTTDGSHVMATYHIRSMDGKVTSISAKAAKKVKAGKTVKIKTTVQTSGDKANRKLSFTSSNTKYATVTKTGKVKTKKAGKGKTVKITIQSTDGSGVKKVIKIKIK
ncbi:MAG: Ig-like domain-containing protein [Eubacterium sp.]|nr:Ig-like domain-containing protein [Eubacterium sp.]